MRIFSLILFFCIPNILIGQILYDPQQLYDSPGGLFEEDSIREIHLEFYDPNYHNILQTAWYYDPDFRLPAKLTLNESVYDSVGVRYKGNSTFCLPNDNGNVKVPYNIDINYFIENQTLLGYNKLKLANAWMDPTFMKDIVASNIYRKYLPSGEANLMKLYVQGNYIGLYVNGESINKQFLKKHYDEKKGPLFKCDNIDRFCDTANAPSAMPPNLYYMGDDTTLYYNSYDMKSDHGWEELVHLIKTIETDFNNIDSILNVDRTLWAFAVNQVILNLDCYNTYYVHNYYLYQTKDGLFQMIPWDLDNSFVGAILGSFWPWSSAYEYDPFFTVSPNSQPWEVRPLLDNLLSNPFYRKLYTTHLRTIINESLDTAFIRAEINNLQQLAYSAADNDQNKAFSMQDYFNNVESAIWTGWSFGGIMSTIDARKQFLLSHPEILLSGPSIYNLNIAENTVSISVMNSDFVELMVTTNEYNSKFHSFAMVDDGTNGDLIANDGIFSCIFPFNGNTQVKFYIRAQNNDAISLFPERAEYEFFEYSTISGLNDITLNNKKLILITDLLGRRVVDNRNISHQPLLYIYDDGTVEKKLQVD
jgi:hypothetical protein